MKKRVKADVQMVREYLNVIILSLGILILQLYTYHLFCSLFPRETNLETRFLCLSKPYLVLEYNGSHNQCFKA